MLMKRVKTVVIIVAFVAVLALLAFTINENINKKVFVKEYTFTHENLPSAFDESKIFVISDLHEADFANQIIAHIKNANPDFVVMLGDMVQLPDHSIDKTLQIAEYVLEMGIPIYAVSGNHDRQCGHYDKIIEKLWAADGYMLENGSITLEKDGQRILLAGIKDPRHDVPTEYKLRVMRDNIKYELSKESEDTFSVLLSHRADLYPNIKDTGVDLILSGHLHGGVIRLPFVGGVIGQDGNDSLFPKYEYGVIKEDDSATMIVSGGCDSNPDKKRYFNPPEVLLITLKGE